jgi:hypothetical protein
MTTVAEHLAARLARVDAGDDQWQRITPQFRLHAIERWRDTLETIRRAGLVVVEMEDGR